MLGGGFSGGLGESDYIANIKIEGVIFEDDHRSKLLAEIANEKSIKAVIIEINSPGGGIVGSEILFNDLSLIAKNKPTVVLMDSLAASGGYMAAIASDHIIAHNGTLTGSIGVLMQVAEVTELADKIGVKFNSYKSSPIKGSPSPFEKSSPMIEAVMKESILDSYKFFSDLVKKQRAEKLNKSLEKEIFDGRIFTGRQALQAGLVDEIGGKDQAIKYLTAKLQNKNLPVEDIELIDKKEKIFDRIFGIIPFFKEAKVASQSSNKIMAIMR